MRILAEVVVVLLVLGIAGVLLTSAMGRRRHSEGPPWQVHTRTRGDGTLVVSIRREDADERVVRELPPGMDGIELASELQLAKDEAALAADELNRP